MKDPKAVECLICFERYSVSEILRGLYQLKTMVCSSCYAGMQKKPHKQSCFGKPSEIIDGRKRFFGYEEKAPECSRLCPDREVCRKVIFPV